jgi:signal transduction histidine kinase
VLAATFLHPLCSSATDTPSGHLVEESYPNHNPLSYMGLWIWDDKTMDMQACRFWRAFELPSTNKVASASLFVTGDNEFRLYLNGRELGRGAEWRELFAYDLTQVLPPGQHVLAVEVVNSGASAGMLLGMRIDFEDGRHLIIKSDQDWRLAPETAKNWTAVTRAPESWRKVTVVGAVGTGPWWTEPVRVIVLPPTLPIHVSFWQTAWFQVPFLIVCGLIVLALFFLAAQLALHQKEHWLLQRERARIAMDVHDDIGSRMTHLVLKGEVLQGDLPGEPKVRAQLEQICDEARGVLSSLDEILWALNPRRDTLQDFSDYVCDYAQKFLCPAGIECVFEIDPQAMSTAADMPLRRSLLMAIKETLNNIVKYSQAAEVRLQIGLHRRTLLIAVHDNGRGFDMSGIRPARNGLGNMSRRMRELGGECLIESSPGKGCRIEFRVPMHNPRRISMSWLWRPEKRLSTVIEKYPAIPQQPDDSKRN